MFSQDLTLEIERPVDIFGRFILGKVQAELSQGSGQCDTPSPKYIYSKRSSEARACKESQKRFAAKEKANEF